VSNRRNKLEASYVQTMRELCGVQRSVPAAVLLQELGELPLAVEWKRQALWFCRALTALPETSIFKQAAMDDLAAAQQSNIQNWAAGLLACAKQHGMALTGVDGSMMAAADEGAIAASAAAAAALEQQEFVDMNPRTALSGGVKRTTYAAWFSRPGWAEGGEFWQLELAAPQLRAVQRLRLGSHTLPGETGRFAKMDRQDRCCLFCDSGAVRDEKHFLMECPATDVVRQRFLACLIWRCRRACVSWCGEGTE